MHKSRKIELLQQLLKKSTEITGRNSGDPAFRTWRNTVERVLTRVFGQEAQELTHFHQLQFIYLASVRYPGVDYSSQHQQAFDRDFEILVSSIKGYIEELEQENDEEDETNGKGNDDAIGKVFISHASQDVAFVEELIELLELIGVQSESIFCTSFASYGIDLGENFLDAIRDELNDDTLVLFVLSENFYSSKVCLCEMGATWVQTKDHIPIVVPPFDFADITGVIPLTQGLKINDGLELNLLKEKIESMFSLECQFSQSAWERKRDRIVSRINIKIAEGAS